MGLYTWNTTQVDVRCRREHGTEVLGLTRVLLATWLCMHCGHTLDVWMYLVTN